MTGLYLLAVGASMSVVPTTELLRLAELHIESLEGGLRACRESGVPPLSKDRMELEDYFSSRLQVAKEERARLMVGMGGR